MLLARRRSRTLLHTVWSDAPNPADLPFRPLQAIHRSRVGKQFDRVVIDSPPLVAVTDSAAISTLVDGTVFVIRAFSTTRALGRQGMRTLTMSTHRWQESCSRSRP